MYSAEDYWGIGFSKEPTLPYEWDKPAGNWITWFTNIYIYSKDFNPPEPPDPEPIYPDEGSWYISSGSLDGTGVTWMQLGNKITISNNSGVEVGLYEITPDGNVFLGSKPTGEDWVGIFQNRVRYGLAQVGEAIQAIIEQTTYTPPKEELTVFPKPLITSVVVTGVEPDFFVPGSTPAYPETGGWHVSSGSLDGIGVTILYRGSDSNEITVANGSSVTVGLAKMNPNGSNDLVWSIPAKTSERITLERGVKYGMGEVFDPSAPTPIYPETGGWHVSSGSLEHTGVSILYRGSNSNEIIVNNNSGVTFGLVKMYPDGNTDFLGSKPTGTSVELILERGVKYGMGPVDFPNAPVYPETGGWHISSGTLEATGVTVEFSGNVMTVHNDSGVEVGLIKIISDSNVDYVGSTPTGTTVELILERGVKYGMGEVGELVQITIEQQKVTPPPSDVGEEKLAGIVATLEQQTYTPPPSDVGEKRLAGIVATLEQQTYTPPGEEIPDGDVGTTTVSVPSFNTDNLFPYTDITYYKDNVKYKAVDPSELFDPNTNFQKYDFVSSFVPSNETEKIYTMNVSVYTDTLPVRTEVFVFRVSNDWTKPREYLDRIMVDTEHFFSSTAVPTIPLIPISVPEISINTVPSDIIDAPAPEIPTLKPDEGWTSGLNGSGVGGLGGSSDTINPLNSNNEFSLDKLFKETNNKNKNTKEWMEENSDILDKNNICCDCDTEN